MEELDAAQRGSCLYLTLNRPEKRNALSRGLVGALTAALDMAAADDDVRVVVLRGAGRVFCSGADLSELLALQEASFEENLDHARALAALYRSMVEHPKPLIASLNGHAIGGGCGLALACDFILADRVARLGFTEVRIGFVPAIVAGLVLRRAGEAAARDLLLSGRLTSADEAMRLALVNGVHDGADLATAVDALADQLARETSTAAVAATKRLLREFDGLSLVATFERGATANAAHRQTAEFRAGLEAFLRKEPFPWQRMFDEKDE